MACTEACWSKKHVTRSIDHLLGSPVPAPRLMKRRRQLERRNGRGGRSIRSRILEELADDAQEVVETVVVEPMPGAVDTCDGRVPERLGAAILGGIAGPALLSVDEEGGTRDP